MYQLTLVSSWTGHSRSNTTFRGIGKNYLHAHSTKMTCKLKMEVSAKAPHVAASPLVYSSAEYCALLWYYGVHTDNVLNVTLRTITGFSPTKNLPILSGISPAGLLRLRATLFLANRSSFNPVHIYYDRLVRPLDARKERLKSRRPFVPAALKLLDKTSDFDIRVAQLTDRQTDRPIYLRGLWKQNAKINAVNILI